jgi:hypothetical protein
LNLTSSFSATSRADAIRIMDRVLSFPYLNNAGWSAPELLSIPVNISLGFMQWVKGPFTMLNLRVFTCVTYLAHTAFSGCNAQTNSSQLLEIVPKREVLYVGGKYTNITVSLKSPFFQAVLTALRTL